MWHLCLVSVLFAVDNDQLALCMQKQRSLPAGNRSYYCCKWYQQQHVFHQQNHPPKVYLSLYTYATLLKGFLWDYIPSTARRCSINIKGQIYFQWGALLVATRHVAVGSFNSSTMLCFLWVHHAASLDQWFPKEGSGPPWGVARHREGDARCLPKKQIHFKNNSKLHI